MPTKGVDSNLRKSSIHFGMFHGFQVRQSRLLRNIPDTFAWGSYFASKLSPANPANQVLDLKQV